MAGYNGDTGESTTIDSRQKTEKPRRYKVLMLNDNYTTMEFVIFVLESIFQKPNQEAMQIMLNVHEQGRGTAGVYTRSVAETKIDSVHRLAEKEGFPLKCTMEPQ